MSYNYFQTTSAPQGSLSESNGNIVGIVIVLACVTTLGFVIFGIFYFKSKYFFSTETSFFFPGVGVFCVKNLLYCSFEGHSQN